jgi:hypothetical protein
VASATRMPAASIADPAANHMAYSPSRTRSTCCIHHSGSDHQ